MQRDGGQFGQLAVQAGVLTEAQLRDFLKVQVSEIVYDAFVWDGGTFSFAQETSLPPHAVTISIDLGNLIMEGARRIEEWEQCLQLLPDQSTIFRVVATPRDEKITLTADEWKILFLINGQRTIEELCDDSEDDPFQVYRAAVRTAREQTDRSRRRRARRTTPATRRTRSRIRTGTMTADATMRQSSPRFGVGIDDAGRAERRHEPARRVRGAAAVVRGRRPADGRAAEASSTTARVIPLTEPEYLLGRHRDNNIQLTDLGVSGFHARIYRGPEGYVIEDLKSRNGTWVNGARVYQATLTSGDKRAPRADGPAVRSAVYVERQSAAASRPR